MAMNSSIKIFDINVNNQNYKVHINKKNVKRIIIKVNYINTIFMNCPIRCTYDDALKYLNEHKKWLEKVIEKQEENIKNMYIEDCVNKQKVWLQGVLYNIIQTNSIDNLYIFSGNEIYVNGNVDKAIEEIRKELYVKIVEEFNRCSQSFKKYIEQKPYLEIKKMKSRWGSCNFKSGRIVINKMLVHVPIELLQYVMIHEFVHFLYPNHSKNFHRFLNQCLSNNKKLEKNLKNYSFLLKI